MAVCTPGRLKHSLSKGKFDFNCLRYFCLDEADRLMDVGFDEDIRDILSYSPKHTVSIPDSEPLTVCGSNSFSPINYSR